MLACAGVRFEWDRRKAMRNAVRHGVKFEEALTVFLDPLDMVREIKACRRKWEWKRRGLLSVVAGNN
mgnify:CR=1 FL=1